MKKTILIITILLVPVLSSCEMLDLEPKDQISQFDYFKNATTWNYSVIHSTIIYWTNRLLMNKAISL